MVFHSCESNTQVNMCSRYRQHKLMTYYGIESEYDERINFLKNFNLSLKPVNFYFIELLFAVYTVHSHSAI